MSQAFDKRALELNSQAIDTRGACVIYWMQRSQRARDNPALDFAIDLANNLARPTLVYFGLYDEYPMGSARAFQFMLEGLKNTAAELRDRGVGFVMRREPPAQGAARLAREVGACAVIVDEDYLNMGRAWRSEAAMALDVRLVQVDAESVVPVRISQKEEWGAYTLRPKLARVLSDHLVEFPEAIVEHSWSGGHPEGIDMDSLKPRELAASLNVDQHVAPTPYFTGGAAEGLRRLRTFVNERLPEYATGRNEIGTDVSSAMSPYFHFGQLSTRRAALMVEAADAPAECIDAFLEQLIVRRELAFNYCLYNHAYDRLEGAANWARATLDAHRSDPRPEIYELDELEQARTHDILWNAAQTELVRFGKIHPYMRMVWAKAIVEWSPSPEEALARVIYLNDKYALDGRDPVGYANIAWCVFAKHDRPFADRPVFGKVRYMSTAATRRKTDWQKYVKRVEALEVGG